MNIETYISTGVLERHCCGQLSAAETEELLGLLEVHPRLRAELEKVERSLEGYSLANAVEPPAGIVDKILHRISLTAPFDNTRNTASGGQKKTTSGNPPPVFDFPVFGPEMDVAELREMVSAVSPPSSPDNLRARVLSVGEERTYLMLWINEVLPEEVHHDLIEKVAVLQGRCTGYVDGVPYDLEGGDFIEVPPGKMHYLRVVSDEPCVLLVERTALAA